jgi:diaminopimelate decarboxylase
MTTLTQTSLSAELLEAVAAKVGTPFWMYDAAVLRRRIGEISAITSAPGLQARFAMKSCPATRVLREMLAHGIWIDAVSGNEALRALRAGFAPGSNPPVVCFTADVFRDNALHVVLENGLLPNVGSPGMLRTLAVAGYSGPVAIRVNPGFGHGHVNACDTGGPSSKHGIWVDDAAEVAKEAEKCGLKIVMLHAHIGSGPRFEELLGNFDKLAGEFTAMIPQFRNLDAVSLGGGIPHHYRDEKQEDLSRLGDLLASAREQMCKAAGKQLRLEIEPGRYFVAPAATLVSRVADVKRTRRNEKGDGATFVMVDAGFVDLIRPAMYGSYHRISVLGRGENNERERVNVAGPLCESGDVFTRDSEEFLAPRELPLPEPGDLLLLHDAGAYGYAMSSNYNSIGRAPQVWHEEDGSLSLMSRRETVDDLLDVETEQKL